MRVSARLPRSPIRLTETTGSQKEVRIRLKVGGSTVSGS